MLSFVLLCLFSSLSGHDVRPINELFQPDYCVAIASLMVYQDCVLRRTDSEFFESIIVSSLTCYSEFVAFSAACFEFGTCIVVLK
jgi:hypothetical protein